ncbi:protein virilizer homolog [Diadema antillarum]|uniref:protein virilizer homolog n=1 Tax=Diadema antillarum TaxID=105358 RepID=UPI003A8B0EE4
MEVLFVDTLVHDSSEEVNMDLVHFSMPVFITEVRVIPRGYAIHPSIRDDSRLGQTSPPSFKLETFFHNMSNSNATFERLGTLEYKEGCDIQLLTKSKEATERMVVRGNYACLTLMVIGKLASSGTKPQRSPSPPPPPPPPPKQVPQPSKRPIETVISPEPVHPHQPEQNKPSEWEPWSHEREALPKRPRYSEPQPEPISEPSPIPTTTSMPQPIPQKKGPRTPSPPHPAGSGGELWEQPPPPPQGKDGGPPHMWQGGAGEGRGEWQTTDSWAGEGGPPAPPEPGDGGERWETTDSWWDEGNEEEWAEDRRERIHRGPRTPPGEPELQSPDFVEGGREDGGDKASRGRAGSSDDEEDGIDRGQDEAELFEPLSPEEVPQHRKYTRQDLENIAEAERQRPQENDDVDSIGQSYEDILSDEEALEDVDSLRGLLEAGVDLEGLEDDSWPDITPYDPFQHELLPLKVYTDPDLTFYEEEKMKMEENKPEELPKEALAITEMVEDLKGTDYNTKWVATLEELSLHLPLGLAYVSEGVLKVIVGWTVAALDYDVALQQAIAINIRQLKAGTKLVGLLCDAGPTMTERLLNANVQHGLLDLISRDNMASSLKLLAIKALDSTTNWQVGIEQFLGGEQPPEDAVSSCYQRLLKLLLAEQTVRVVTAAASLLNKLHLFEVLSRLGDVTESIVEKVPASEVEVDQEAYQAGEDGMDEMKGEVKPPAEAGEETIDTVESSSLEEERMDGDGASINAGDVEKVVGCLSELLTIIRTAPHTIVQPHPRVFPTSVTINSPPQGNPWPVMCHMFRARNLLECILFLLSCPATSSNDSITSIIVDVLEEILSHWSGLLYLFSQLETSKALLQTLTSNYDDEEPSECQTNLQQLGFRLIYTLSALQYADLIRQHRTAVHDLATHVENEGVLAALSGAYLMAGGPHGRLALARVFGMTDNLECLLPLAHLTETSNAGDEKVALASKKTATYGYAAQLLSIIVQYSEDVRFLHKYAPLLMDSCTEEHVVRKWVQPLKGIRLDSSCVGTLVDHINQSEGQLTSNLNATAPTILTCLRALQHMVCLPETMSTKVQPTDLKYKVATMQLYSSGALSTFIACTKKVSDYMLRPWQQGISLSSGHTHMLESITQCLLNLIRTMLVQLLDNKSMQYCDERIVSNLLPLHTVICSAPATGILSDVESRIQAGIVDVLLTFTQPTLDIAEGKEEEIKKSSWTVMLGTVLEYIPSAPYSYVGGLQLLSEMLPLPLPMQTQEVLSEAEVQQALNLRRLWSLHLHPNMAQIQAILTELSLSSSPLLQHFLRRVSCQLADLAGPTALLVVRSHLQAFLSCLEQREEGTKKEKPCGPDATRTLTGLVYLISQPAIKVAFLHLGRSSSRSDEQYADVLPRLLELLNVPSQSPSHQQAQECIVTFLQSLCDADITLLPSESLAFQEILASSLPGKDHMEAVCGALLDHVTSPDHSYASILPALRMLTMLLDHNYGFFHLKSSLDKRPGAFHSLLTRLMEAFSRESSDYLTTLSNTLDLLHLLLTKEGDQEVGVVGEEGAGTGGGGAAAYRTLAMDVKELGETLRWSDDENHPLRRLEKILVDCCKDDETMEHLLDTVSSLSQALDSPEARPENQPYAPLPAEMGLHDQFNARLVFYVTEDDEERPTSGMWLGLPPLDELDTDPEMVRCDLEEIRSKLLPTFDLQAELAKGLGTDDVSPDKKKRGFTRRYDPLTYRSGHKVATGIRRAHRGYGRPDFSGRGRGGYDLFRQRAQNTSRPPSMHVDDFVAAEQAHTGPQQKQQRGPPGRSSRGDFQRGGMGGTRGSFHGNQGSWNAPNYRRDGGSPMGRGGRGRGQWGNRQQRGPFDSGQRNFAQRSRSDGGPDNRMGPRDQVYNRNGAHERSYTLHGGPRGGGGVPVSKADARKPNGRRRQQRQPGEAQPVVHPASARVIRGRR